MGILFCHVTFPSSAPARPHGLTLSGDRVLSLQREENMLELSKKPERWNAKGILKIFSSFTRNIGFYFLKFCFNWKVIAMLWWFCHSSVWIGLGVLVSLHLNPPTLPSLRLVTGTGFRLWENERWEWLERMVRKHTHVPYVKWKPVLIFILEFSSECQRAWLDHHRTLTFSYPPRPWLPQTNSWKVTC